MNRRKALSFMTAACWPGGRALAADPAALLRAGACVVMLRHAQTEAGIGDPPGFSLADCASQRMLSQAGRQQAARLGQWFRREELAPRAVLSSAWCRCRDTATLAFGKHQVLDALNSTFDNNNDPNAQTLLLRARLRTVQAGQFEVWVTHQVNISAFTGESTSMGEGLIVQASGAVLVRLALA